MLFFFLFTCVMFTSTATNVQAPGGLRKKIDDSTFASGIEFMIKEQIIQVPETEKATR